MFSKSAWARNSVSMAQNWNTIFNIFDILNYLKVIMEIFGTCKHSVLYVEYL